MARTACFCCFSSYRRMKTFRETYIDPHLGVEVFEEVGAEALKALGHIIDGILLFMGFDQVEEALHGEVRWYLVAGTHLPSIGAL